jgi:hypothetical protein
VAFRHGVTDGATGSRLEFRVGVPEFLANPFEFDSADSVLMESIEDRPRDLLAAPRSQVGEGDG